jgi:hypothetical protein
MSDRALYEAAAIRLLNESGCTVRKYHDRLTGKAYTHATDWGIVVPHPTTARRFATFAHEIGHQMLHRAGNSKPRWLEEWEAWDYAFRQFDRFNLPGLEIARDNAAPSLRYAARKAERRCSPETAQEILDTYPDWVWVYDDPIEAVLA